MGNRKSSLLVKFGLIFLVFILVTLGITGVATTVQQSRAYQREQQEKLQNIASYLSQVLQEDGPEFPLYQRYFVEHYEDVGVPADFVPTDVYAAQGEYMALFAEQYPGKVLGVDINPEGLDLQVQKAYARYNHERYLSLFEEAAKTFGLDYAYYLVPTGEDHHMYPRARTTTCTGCSTPCATSARTARSCWA